MLERHVEWSVQGSFWASVNNPVNSKLGYYFNPAAVLAVSKNWGH